MCSLDGHGRSSDLVLCVVFFFNDTATTEIYTLSLHDALPILTRAEYRHQVAARAVLALLDLPREEVHLPDRPLEVLLAYLDRKSTRLNSSHANISYAVFCLKKKKTQHRYVIPRPAQPPPQQLY